MTLTVFTTVIGKTDRLKVPSRVNPSVRYVCFTDQTITVRPYERVLVPRPTGAPRVAELKAREFKILADHPALGNSDIVLWHDAAYRMDCDPVEVAARHLDTCDLLAFAHPHRSRIEDEAVAVWKLGYVSSDTVTRQVAAYRAAGFTDQRVITSTGFCLRRRMPEVQAFNRLWWNEVAQWGWRDQMSVDYALWKTGIRVGYLPGHYRDNPYAKWFTAREALLA